MRRKIKCKKNLRKANGEMENRLVVSILKLRKNIQELYQKQNRWMDILAKGVAALALFLSINTLYNDTKGVALIMAVMFAVICSVLPKNWIYPASAVLTTIHLFHISWDIAAAYLAAVVLSYLLLCRMKPETAVIIAFAPLFFQLKVPFLLSLLVGCFSSLFGVAAMAFGAAFYYIGVYSKDVVNLLSSATGKETVIAVKTVIDRFSADKNFFLLLGAMVIAAIVVYLLYHQSMDYSWYIGIVAGGLLGLVVYLAGGIIFDIETGNLIYVFTIPVAVLAACGVQFFRCVIDYTGVEMLEFEDDEYYYYVKAVPKINNIVDDFAVADQLEAHTAKYQELEEKK